jgi:hypothetical protein
VRACNARWRGSRAGSSAGIGAQVGVKRVHPGQVDLGLELASPGADGWGIRSRLVIFQGAGPHAAGAALEARRPGSLHGVDKALAE